MSKHDALGLAILLASVLVAGCGVTPADMPLQAAPAADAGVSLTPARLDLIVLHTNDNWGETEPCG